MREIRGLLCHWKLKKGRLQNRVKNGDKALRRTQQDGARRQMVKFPKTEVQGQRQGQSTRTQGAGKSEQSVEQERKHMSKSGVQEEWISQEVKV